MRWLVTGARGMLGHDLTAALAAAGDADVTPTDLPELDITDPAAVDAAVAGHDVLINCAAFTDVDGAEAREWVATQINGFAVGNLARACAAHGARMVHVSTDYVFAGDATTPYPEDAPPLPVNSYGRGKLLGERAVSHFLPDAGYVVRTAWLYGGHGRNFVTTMLKLAAERDTVEVVTDQTGQPTWTGALADRLVALGRAAAAGRAPAGAYHGTAAGSVSWYGFARAIFELAGLDPERVRPTTSEKFPRPARRPAYSVLGHDRWAECGLAPLADWHSMLTEALRGGDLTPSAIRTAPGTGEKSTQS